MSNRCLNCNAVTENNYCSVCGQKNSTHRFSMNHFIMHDLIHGVFHLDKGFLYTIKQLFTRPGHSIREFVQGKRNKHFNYFTSVILLLTISHFIGNLDITSISADDLFKKGTVNKQYLKLINEYAKIITLLGIPLYALGSYLIFKKSKQNYTENLVLCMYLMSGVVIIGLLLPFSVIICKDLKFLQNIKYVILILEFSYYFWFFYQYFSVFKYGKISLILRCLLMSVLMFIIKGCVNFGIDKIGTKYF